MTNATIAYDSLAATAVDGYLQAVSEGPDATFACLYRDDASLDAVVPGSRFQVDGATAIGDLYATWFNVVGALTEVRRRPTPEGAVLEYTFDWEESGVSYAARQIHVFNIDWATGLITDDRVWCGGRCETRPNRGEGESSPRSW